MKTNGKILTSIILAFAALLAVGMFSSFNVLAADDIPSLEFYARSTTAIRITISSDGCTGYEIKYSKNSDMSECTIIQADYGKKNYKIDNLDSGTAYYIKVRNYTVDNGTYTYSRYSSKIKAATKTKTPSVSFYKNAIDAMRFKIKGVTCSGYQVRYSTKINMKSAKTITVKTDAKQVRISDLHSGTLYYIQIRAYVTANGEKIYGEWSKKVKGKTRSKPTTIKFTKYSDSAVRMKIATKRACTGYQVRFSTKSSMKSSSIINVKKSAKEARIADLTEHTKYYVQIRTYITLNNKNYYSAWSNKKSITTMFSGKAGKIVASMTLNEKVAQLFVISPETLTGGSAVTKSSTKLTNAYKKYPVGGFILKKPNITSPSQITTLNSNLTSMSKKTTGLIPFIAVDEEGGTVARIGSNSGFSVKNVGNMSTIGASKNTNKAYNAGTYIGNYLKKYGFNVDFAPVADVWTNKTNTVVKYRSFGSNAALDAKMVTAFTNGLHSKGIASTLKHFPGHGNTTADSHKGQAVSNATLSQLRKREFLPFEAGIEADTEFIMIGHIALPNVTGNYIPASLSKKIVTTLLRNELGYDGIIITDSMGMGAVTKLYSSGPAAVKAIQAGCDMVLSPANFTAAYNAVLSAVRSGEITEGRIDESVHRIVLLKLKMSS